MGCHAVRRACFRIMPSLGFDLIGKKWKYSHSSSTRITLNQLAFYSGSAWKDFHPSNLVVSLSCHALVKLAALNKSAFHGNFPVSRNGCYCSYQRFDT